MLAASFFDKSMLYTCGEEQNDSHVSGFPSMLETFSAVKS